MVRTSEDRDTDSSARAPRVQAELPALVVHAVSIKTGNAEMPAQMEKIDGIQIAGDGGQRQAFGRVDQDYRAAKVGAVHHHPHVGVVVVDRAARVAAADHVLPTAQMIGLADRFNLGWIGRTGLGKAQRVHADAVQLGNGLLHVFVGVGHQAGGRRRASTGRR